MAWYLLRKRYPGLVVEEKVRINEEVMFGRGRDCAVLCLSVFVSRHHCQVRAHSTGSLCLVDLGSSNGTYINAIKVNPHEEQILSEGDEIGIGNIDANDKNSFVYVVHKDGVLLKTEYCEAAKNSTKTSSIQQKSNGSNTRKRIADENKDMIEMQVVTLLDSEEEAEVKPCLKKPKLEVKQESRDNHKKNGINELKPSISGLTEISNKSVAIKTSGSESCVEGNTSELGTSSRGDTTVQIENGLGDVDKPTNRRLSSLRPHSTPCRSHEERVPALVTSTPCVGLASVHHSSEVWSPILVEEEQEGKLSLSTKNPEDRELAKRERPRVKQKPEDPEPVKREHSQVKPDAKNPELVDRERARVRQEAKDRELAEREQMAVDRALADQIASDRALAEQIAAEQTTVLPERPSSMVNYSVDEEVITISGDEDEFPMSQIFERKPDPVELAENLNQAKLKDIPPAISSPERDGIEDIILIEDEDEDDDDVLEASRWFERLSQSQSSCRVKEEPIEFEERVSESLKPEYKASSDQRKLEGDAHMTPAVESVKGRRKSSASTTSSELSDEGGERRDDGSATCSSSTNKGRVSKDTSSTYSFGKSEAKIHTDLDEESSEEEMFPKRRTSHSYSMDSAPKTDLEEDTDRRKKSSKRDSERRRSDKETERRIRSKQKHRSEHHPSKKDAKTSKKGDKLGSNDQKPIKTDRKSESRNKTDMGWRKTVGIFIEDSDDSVSAEETEVARPVTPLEVRVKLTRVEDDRTLSPLLKVVEDPTEEDVDGEVSDAASNLRDTQKPAGRKIALTDPLPMPPRRAHKRGISAQQATRMFQEGQTSRKSPVVDKKDLRKQKLAEVAKRKKDEEEKRGSKRGSNAPAPAKVKVTASNRGSFLTQAEDLAAPSRPRSRRDVVREMSRIPKKDVSVSVTRLPHKSPLQAMNMSWDRARPAQIEDVPLPLPPLEIPTGPQPKKRIAKPPPPGFNDDAAPKKSSAGSGKCTPGSKLTPSTGTLASPRLRSCNDLSLQKLSTLNAIAQKSVKSILCGSSQHNIAANKVKKRVRFRENLVEVREIDRVPGTRPVSSSRDAGLPSRTIDSIVFPKPPFIPQDETALLDVIYDLSKWNPKWLHEEKLVTPDTVPPVVSNMNLPTIPRTEFLDFKEYYDTMYPLLMLELWSGVSKEYNIRESQHNSRNVVQEDIVHGGAFMAVDQVICAPLVSRPERVLTTLHCHMLVDGIQRDDSYPRLGNLVVLDLPLLQDNNIQVILPVFGYVSFDRRERADPRMQCHKDLLKKCPRPASKLTFYVQVRERKNSKIVVDKPIRIKNVKYIRGDLRVFQAIKHLAHLPLQNCIISPSAANSDFSLPDVSNRQLAWKEVLNPTQQKMVLQTAEVCLQEKPRICLIQGPPGTGKSHVITSLVLQLLYRDRLYSKYSRDKGLIPRILLCAPSNNAIDVLARRLLERRRKLEQQHRFKMVRVGQPTYIHPEVKGISLQELAKQDIKNQNQDINDPNSIQTDISNWKAKLAGVEHLISENSLNCKPVSESLTNRRADLIRGLKVLEDRLRNARLNGNQIQSNRDFAIQKECSKKILRGADIVATTLSSCLIKVMETVFQPSPNKYQFSVCIVDEATQCLEAETLIPLMLGVKTLVLVGDPRQLPATILSRVSRDRGLGASLFARLQKCVPSAVQLLDVQYRMHPEILTWPSKYFYERRLRSPENFEKLRDAKVIPYAILSLPYHQEGETNDLEARLVSRLSHLLLEQKVVECNQIRVGIVTPYQNQKRLLQQYIERIEPRVGCVIDVNTVDSFQGQEADVIIMSCVRTSGIGFLGDQQRLNVALTRAKYALYLCGNFDSLAREPMWSNLLSDARQRRCFLTLPPSISKDELWNLISKK